MRFEECSFGSIRIDGVTYDHDVVIDRGEVQQTQEEAIQEVPPGLWTHAAVDGGRDPVDVQEARDRSIAGSWRR
jgi:hypothetical protein